MVQHFHNFPAPFGIQDRPVDLKVNKYFPSIRPPPSLPKVIPRRQCSQSATLKNRKIQSKTQTLSPSLPPPLTVIPRRFPSTSRPPPPSERNAPPRPSPLKSQKPRSTKRLPPRNDVERSIMMKSVMNRIVFGSF